MIKKGTRVEWWLKPSAVPTKFANKALPSYFNRSNKRPAPKQREVCCKIMKGNDSTDNFVGSETDHDFRNIRDVRDDRKAIILLKDSWGLHEFWEGNVLTHFLCLTYVRRGAELFKEKFVSVGNHEIHGL